MTNSADPDQLASSFAKTGHVVFSKRRVRYPRRGFIQIPILYDEIF